MRVLTKIVSEICEELDYKLLVLSQDWLLLIEAKNSLGEKITKRILGYNFDLNPAASTLIAKDKVACFELLESCNIPAVEHRILFSPFSAYSSFNLGERFVENFFDKCNQKLVLKPNDGTGGRDVFRVTNKKELEESLNKLFLSYTTIALSPFENFEDEFRVLILDGEVKLVFKKLLPTVLGDGKSTILDLVVAKKSKDHLKEQLLKDFLESNTADVNEVLPKDKIFALSWKHNLGLGATASFVDCPKTLKILSDLAVQAAQSIGLRFCSVDIICVNNNGQQSYKVLEVNSGVMMENFASISESNFQIARGIYLDALRAMMQ